MDNDSTVSLAYKQVFLVGSCSFNFSCTCHKYFLRYINFPTKSGVVK